MSDLNKLKQALERVDEVQLLELLDIKTDELIERFEDKIEARRNYLEKEMEIFSEETDVIEPLDFGD